MTPELASLHAQVYGRVQGVFFRAFVQQKARELGLTGYVRNLSDGRSVEVYAEGEEANLQKLAEQLKVGPRHARVDRVELTWDKARGTYSGFDILSDY